MSYKSHKVNIYIYIYSIWKSGCVFVYIREWGRVIVFICGEYGCGFKFMNENKGGYALWVCLSMEEHHWHSYIYKCIFALFAGWAANSPAFLNITNVMIEWCKTSGKWCCFVQYNVNTITLSLLVYRSIWSYRRLAPALAVKDGVCKMSSEHEGAGTVSV